MNDNNLVIKLKKLADEGEFLLQSGYEISANAPPEVASPVFNWLLKSNNLISQIYGKNSSEMKEFKEAYTIRMSVNLLVSLAANEILKNNSEQQDNGIPEHSVPEQPSGAFNQVQIAGLTQEHSKRIFFILENSVKPELRTNALKLFESVCTEVTSSHPRWDMVSYRLKSGFDYGIPFGSELAQLACIHYNSKKSG